MLNVLLVASSEKTIAYLKDFLCMEDTMNITSCRQGAKARRLALEKRFDIMIINYPLKDEIEPSLPLDLIEKSDASIMMMAGGDAYEAIAERMEKAGIFVFRKPVNKLVLVQVLKFAIITQNRLQGLRHKNADISVRLQEIKIIDRAKCLLIEHENLTETQAHRYLEKKAMDTQMSRLQVARHLITKYQ